MKFISNIRFRSKLFLLFFPPTILYTIIVAVLIGNGVQNVTTLHTNKELISASRVFIELSNALGNEEIASMNYIHNHDVGQLKRSRIQTEEAIIALRNMMDQKMSGELYFIEPYQKELILKLGKLVQIREAIDTGEIGRKEIDHYFGNLLTDFLIVTEEIEKRYKVSHKLFNSIRALSYLLAEKHALQRQHIILETASIDGNVTWEELIGLAQVKQQERIFNYLFLAYAEEQQKERYLEYTGNYSVTQSKSLVEEMIRSGNPPSQVELKKLNAIESHRNSIFSQLLTEYSSWLIKKIEKSIRTALSWLIPLSILSLLILAVIFIYNWAILKDVLQSLSRMIQMARSLAKNDLTLSLTPSNRKDEYGKLEAVIYELGQSLQRIISAITRSSNSISSASSEIQSSVEVFKQDQVGITSSVAETNNTMEELRQTSDLNSQKTMEVMDRGKNTLDIIHTGADAIQQTIEDLTQIQQGMTTISDSTNELNQHCQQIEIINNSVQLLAEQSHVLAINASIEAAKAGDHGKGFSVVAQEMRNMAEQSKEETVRVRKILSDIQASMNTTVIATDQGRETVFKGVSQSQQTSEIMTTMTDGMNIVMSASQEINTSSQQQFSAVTQATEAISEIRNAAEKQKVKVGEVEGAIGELARVMKVLQELVQQFKLPESELQSGSQG
ncbi:MAG: hypothetical protein S4CHLAM102_10720 [Chlamydiia bacterium]|nr:hypothetical protein [Chlamydiia bacterium]